VKGELKTIGTSNLKCIRHASKMTTVDGQTDHFIRTASCEAVRWNNFEIRRSMGGSVATL